MNDIVNHIPYGRENAIRRDKLCRIAGLGDRAMREEIEKARHDGIIILNDQDGKGYFRSDDIEDIYRQYKQNRSRARSILHQNTPLRRVLREAGRIKPNE